MADEELIKKFVELHSQAEKLLNDYKLSEAKQKYLEVVEAYHVLEKSPLERFHKELAYDQVSTLFKKVNDSKERVKIPYHLIAAGVLIIAFSVLVFLKPNIVGLAGFEDLIRQQIDLTFTDSGIKQATLRDRPLTLSASGSFTGSVKLFYKQGEKLELIFDSETSPSTDGTFTDVCEETCDIIAQSNTVELFAQVEKGSTLKLTELSYKVERKENTAPAWTGKSRTFKAKTGQPLTLYMDKLFTDPENDPLVFLSTTADGLDVTVQNNEVTILPHTKGTKSIVFIASDLLEVTRISVTIEVQ